MFAAMPWYNPVLLAAGVAFAFGPPLFACRAVFRFPQMARLVGSLLVVWQIVLAVPACVIVAAKTNGRLAPIPAVFEDSLSLELTVIIMWLVLLFIYGMLSACMYLRYWLECKHLPRNFPTDWQWKTNE
jgi:hypothetical protein